MKKYHILYCLIAMFTLASAGGWLPEPEAVIRTFSDAQIMTFLDSVAQLSVDSLMEKSASIPDSIFKNQFSLNNKLSLWQDLRLKAAAKKGNIDLHLAQKIITDLQIDTAYVEKGRVDIALYPFKKMKEFAFTLGDQDHSSECDLYFYKSGKIVARHHIRHRYGLQLEHFTDTGGNTVVHYKENFMSGSGILWYNTYFYQICDTELIPVLNCLQNANLQYPWGQRILVFESEIIKTEPLTVKMSYWVDFSIPYPSVSFISGCDTIQYDHDPVKNEYLPDYSNSSLSEARILSYYLINNELLFIRGYSQDLKDAFTKSESRDPALNYLDSVMENISH